MVVVLGTWMSTCTWHSLQTNWRNFGYRIGIISQKILCIQSFGLIFMRKAGAFQNMTQHIPEYARHKAAYACLCRIFFKVLCDIFHNKSIIFRLRDLTGLKRSYSGRTPTYGA